MKKNIHFLLFFFFFSVSPSHHNIFANQKLTVMTLNTGLLPWPLGMKQRKKRAKKIAKTILNLTYDPDIIALQEVFGESYQRKITKKIKNKYPYILQDFQSGRHIFGVDSGLVLASKFPIEKRILKEYKHSLGDGNLARKGVMGIKIQHPVLGPVYVFTTHMQAGINKFLSYLFDFYKKYKNDSDLASRLQLKEARKWITSFVDDKDRFHATILYMGDFNIKNKDKGDDKEEYQQTLQILKAQDTYRQQESAARSTVWRTEEELRIDYIFNLSSHENLKGSSFIINDFNKKMTDHRAVIGEFHL